MCRGSGHQLPPPLPHDPPHRPGQHPRPIRGLRTVNAQVQARRPHQRQQCRQGRLTGGAGGRRRNLLTGLGDAADRFRFRVRDRDTKFTGVFDAVFTVAGVEILKAPPRSPRVNAYAERWARTVRTECLDWTLICTDRHLHRVLTEYVRHDNTARLSPGPRPGPAGASAGARCRCR
jgi:hypothetical protein